MGTALSGGNSALGAANTASAANQSFFDQLGGSFAQGLGKTLSGGGGGQGSTGSEFEQYLFGGGGVQRWKRWKWWRRRFIKRKSRKRKTYMATDDTLNFPLSQR